MNTPNEVTDTIPGERIVYVRPIHAEDLPAELRAKTEGMDELYSVHAANGERLALVRDRKLAFQLARQNDLTPVDVH
jgi:hypothetical protein